MMDKLTASKILDSSSEELNDVCVDQVVNVDHITVPPQRPHFLDYDAAPPPEYEENSDNELNSMAYNSCSPVETYKYDKQYRGSDSYSLPSSSLGRREHKHQQHRMHSSEERCTGTRRKKHFLDENPIAPDYMLDKTRGHRSLEESFERPGEYDSFRIEQRRCFERESLARKPKEANFAPPKFVRSDRSPSIRSNEETMNENIVEYPTNQPKTWANLGLKVECVYSLLSMLGSHDPAETSKKFLELSRSVETCATLRRSGCIPLLVQIMHSESDEETRRRAALALHNVVHCNFDDKAGRREAKVLRLIEQIIEYCNFLKSLLIEGGETIADDVDRHPLAAVSSLMKVSFDEEHRHAMCQLGALQAIASLVHLDNAAHGASPDNQVCNSLRRYALMALTNLTFGDGNNKALLCANKEFMEALVAQLDSAPDDLLQVTASVLRNLSWRADNNMKAVLNEIGTVTALTKAAMKNKNENTLKAILSALWNLSAHCSTNKTELCAVEGALAFLVDMLTYEGPSKTLKIIENTGGILRNVSSHVAVREDFRKILRQKNCLSILLQQLKSESLTVVSNACGTLWNLSARFPEDQKYLWDNGAVPMLRSLIHSKHKMISEGSSAALKNLLNFRPSSISQNNMDPIAKSLGLKELPSLNARKQRALEAELNRNLAETCDNIDTTVAPKDKNDSNFVDDTKEQSEASSSTRPAVIPKVDSGISKQKKQIFPVEKIRGEHKPVAIGEQGRSQSFGIRNNFVESGFDIDQETEHPIDYSAKYDTEAGNLSKVDDTHVLPKTARKGDIRNYAPYQETDLDQLTDFSLRYAENRVDCEPTEKVLNPGSEIILILEDTVKCYETEGTPYAISNAASVSDLRNTKIEDAPVVVKNETPKTEGGQVFAFGTYSPEKPVNYCEEGTPGYYSRYDSFSSLEESPHNCNNITKVKPDVVEEENLVDEHLKDDNEEAKQLDNKLKPSPTFASQSPTAMPVKPAVGINSAQETPLMFSRRSSMDSVASAEPNTADDKSSVVSDFSRLASGAISPSEIPDSPTQSMPQSPRRTNHIESAFSSSVPQNTIAQKSFAQQRLRSVFEDDVNTFRVENTPAQFSCATSLSNLSLEDEPKMPNDNLSKELPLNANMEVAQTSKATTQEVKPDKSGDNCILSDIEEGNDDIILANCISIGMNRGRKDNEQKKPGVQRTGDGAAGDDFTIQYCTEDTPGLSTAVSNSNLSALSLCTNKCETNLSDESSNASDSNELLEQCIREGMEKSSAAKQRQNDCFVPVNLAVKQPKDPIDMLRRGGYSSYLPVRDEMNKFHVEDSPCNHSVLSGLSNLTVGSEVVGLAEMKTLKDPDVKTESIPEVREREDDSLSSTSVEDMRPLKEAIAAGANKVSLALFTSLNEANNPSTSKMVETFDNMTLRELNESISSIDSSDSNDNQSKSLLEQCIRTGMIKEQKNEKTAKSVPSLKTIQPTTSVNSFQKPVRNGLVRQKTREKKDEQLLIECINTGMSKNVRAEADTKTLPQRCDQIVGRSSDSMQQNIPKNGRTTSAVVPDQTLKKPIPQNVPDTAPDVGKLNAPSDINNELKNLQQPKQLNTMNTTGFKSDDASLNNVQVNNNHHHQNGTAVYESSSENEDINISVSQEILDKQKDPNLMLRSVERLTKELVTQAEILRANRPFSMSHECDVTNFEGESSNNSTSDNTWNEISRTNDNSFPSISMMLPVVASIKDDETTLSDDIQTVTDSPPFCEMASTNEDMPAETPVNECCDKNYQIEFEKNKLTSSNDAETHCENGIKFHVGQEVNQIDRSTGCMQYVNTSSFEVSSVMSNSAIIAMEAKKLANQLMDSNTSGSSISLDLDNIRPPSGMECLSMSGFVDPSRSPQALQYPKKSLLTGIVAKRALESNHIFMGGSAENLNSGCNLDSIKPPSLMDELLDSMISVASITSEIVDVSLPTLSNYETACNNLDDNTLALHSCTEDFSSNFDSATPEISEFSSAESTPVKKRTDNNVCNNNNVKRSMMTKERRHTAKERYRTYTIDVDVTYTKETVTNGDEHIEICLQEDDDDATFNINQTTVTLSVEKHEETTPNNNSIELSNRKKQDHCPGTVRRRTLDPERFKTRTIVFDDITNCRGISAIPNISTTCNENFSHLLDISGPPSIPYFSGSSEDVEDDKSTTSSGADNTIKSENEVRTNRPPSVKSNEAVQMEEQKETNLCILKAKMLNQQFLRNESQNGKYNVKTTNIKRKSTYTSPYKKGNISLVKATATKPKCEQTNVGAKIAIPVNRKSVVTKPQSKIAAPQSKVVEKNPLQHSKSAVLNSKTRTEIEFAKKAITDESSGKCLKKMDSSPALERQGTFVKDEPSNADVPVISSPPSRVPKPAFRSSIAKTTVGLTRIGKKTETSPQNGLVSTGKVAKTNRPTLTPPSSRITAAQSTTILRQTSLEAAKRKTPVGVVQNSNGFFGQRSKSNTVIRSSASASKIERPSINPSRSNLNQANLKNVNSRISSVWKKNTDSRRKSSGFENSTVTETPQKFSGKPAASETKSKPQVGLSRLVPPKIVASRLKEPVPSPPVNVMTNVPSNIGSFGNVDHECQVAG